MTYKRSGKMTLDQHIVVRILYRMCMPDRGSVRSTRFSTYCRGCVRGPGHARPDRRARASSERHFSVPDWISAF